MIGERMEAERKARKWSMRELAERSGISEGYLWLLARGRRPNPTIETLEKLARAFDITVDALVNSAAHPAPPDIGTPPEELLRAAGYHEDTIRRLIESWPRQPAPFRLEVVTEARQRVEEAQRQEDRIRAALRNSAPVI